CRRSSRSEECRKLRRRCSSSSSVSRSTRGSASASRNRCLLRCAEVAAAAAKRLEVFAVDVDMVQVCWSDLSPGAHSLEVDGEARLTLEGGGPGSAIVE